MQQQQHKSSAQARRPSTGISAAPSGSRLLCSPVKFARAHPVPRGPVLPRLQPCSPLVTTPTHSFPQPSPETAATLGSTVFITGVCSPQKNRGRKRCTNFRGQSQSGQQTPTSAAKLSVPVHTGRPRALTRANSREANKKSFSSVSVVEEMRCSERVNMKKLERQSVIKEKVFAKVQEFERRKRDPNEENLGKAGGDFVRSNNLAETPAKFRRPSSCISSEEASPACLAARPRTAAPSPTKRRTTRNSLGRCASVRNGMRVHWNRFARSLKKCLVGQEEADNDLALAEKLEKQMSEDMETMRSVLDKKIIIERRERLDHIKHMAANKPLFMYGPDGAGRFVNAKGGDFVRTCDLVLRVNPKYKFLKGTLSRMLIKSD